MLLCTSLSLVVCLNSYPLCQWNYLTISSSATLFFCPQSFPASRPSPVNQLLASGGQSIGACVSISPSNEYSGFISFRVDWLDLLAVLGTLKSLLQHHNLKVPVLPCSAFFMTQLSHLNMTIGKNIALTVQTFLSKVMSLLFKYAL